ncbi:T9SS type B sorting domain-containing protein [Aquimarina intermedia]|uniref:Gliding motility-associated-like protein n=1 Tax=Aquimarina intermedia TaxID=350814 RepID=A0A5S5CC27_9FLAO|nr:gliding motility-associated C-terminal domain-containing protein [Aquimarina intermedia]TYP76897.1 gliding motility-associated-like protein [Aquimarina intermedia]
MKNKLNLTSLLLLAVLLISSHELAAQRAISAPVFENGSTQICASPGNNTFTVIATLSAGPALDNSNQYILEVSAPDGTFADTDQNIELARVTGPNDSNEGEIRFENFSVDESLNSDTYRLRIRASTDDSVISSESVEIAMHYFRNDLTVVLNSREDVILCNTASINRTINPVVLDDIGNELNVDDFKWQWYRGDLGTSAFDAVAIPGETSSSYTVTQEGKYVVKIFYGKCQIVYNKASSNAIEVFIVDVADVFINEGASVAFCPQDAKVLTSSETNTDYTYQWFKNDTAIEGEIASTITLPDNDFGGNYTLEVRYSEDCTVTTDPIAVTNNGSSITETLPENLIILPTQTITLQVTTDAPEGSTVQWFVDTNLQKQEPLSGTTSTFEANFVGRYRVRIQATDACNSVIESQTEIFAPIGFESTIGSGSDLTCDDTTVDIALQEMVGVTASDLRVPLTQDQYSFFDFEWLADGATTGDTETTLTVDTANQDAVYQLQADLKTGEFSNILSNEVSVKYVASDTEITLTPDSLPKDGSITLTVPPDDSYTYEWYRVVDDEEQVIEGATTNEITVSETGDYFVRIASVFCSLDTPIVTVSEEAALSAFIPNIVTPNSDGINDTWNLPDELTDSPEVEVIIYDSRGQIALQTTNYRNGDWPNDTDVSKETVYYFIITKNNSVIRKGSITVMK